MSKSPKSVVPGLFPSTLHTFILSIQKKNWWFSNTLRVIICPMQTPSLRKTIAKKTSHLISSVSGMPFFKKINYSLKTIHPLISLSEKVDPTKKDHTSSVSSILDSFHRLLPSLSSHMFLSGKISSQVKKSTQKSQNKEFNQSEPFTKVFHKPILHFSWRINNNEKNMLKRRTF